MPERYPGYDVLAKLDTPSWNDATRRVLEARLAMPREPRFFRPEEWETLLAICDRITPQPKHRPPVPVAALVDEKMAEDKTDGYRDAKLPKMQEAWQRGLAALAGEAKRRHGEPFPALTPAAQDALLRGLQQGELDAPELGGMPGALFFSDRLLQDIVVAYYAHPIAWNQIGFGGPASPRGYVRMGFDERDPWEATEAKPGREEEARQKNRNVG